MCFSQVHKIKTKQKEDPKVSSKFVSNPLDFWPHSPIYSPQFLLKPPKYFGIRGQGWSLKIYLRSDHPQTSGSRRSVSYTTYCRLLWRGEPKRLWLVMLCFVLQNSTLSNRVHDTKTLHRKVLVVVQ